MNGNITGSSRGIHSPIRPADTAILPFDNLIAKPGLIRLDSVCQGSGGFGFGQGLDGLFHRNELPVGASPIGNEDQRETGMHIGRREFEAAVERAIETIPEMFRAQLTNITIAVEERPSADLLEEVGLLPGEPLFGVFIGVSLPERSASEPPLYPDEILIFREPLMAACRSLDELEEEIAITVVHEVAHYLGIDEDRLEELGYG